MFIAIIHPLTVRPRWGRMSVRIDFLQIFESFGFIADSLELSAPWKV